MGCRGCATQTGCAFEKAGIEVAEFFPAIFSQAPVTRELPEPRKIVVIDGRIGFVGGFNMEEYVGKDKKFGYGGIRICIEGSAVTSLAVRFVLDWNYAGKSVSGGSAFEIPTYIRNGRDPIQIISSGPDSRPGDS